MEFKLSHKIIAKKFLSLINLIDGHEKNRKKKENPRMRTPALGTVNPGNLPLGKNPGKHLDVK